MRRALKTAFVWASVCMFATWGTDLRAEPNGPFSTGFSLNIPAAVGDTSDVLTNGFGFAFDLGYRKPESPLGLRLDMVRESFNLSSQVLNQIARADTGYATVWGFDLSLLLTPPKAEKVRPYIQAGPGFYYQYAQASRFSGNGGTVCDPWFGCYPVSASTTLLDWSTWRLGWMGGAGISIQFDSGGELFFQTQYHTITNAHQDTEFMPISMGYRWTF